MRKEGTYSIASGIFLLGPDDCTTSVSGVDGTLASNDFLSSNSAAAAAGLASDLRDGIPVIHGGQQLRWAWLVCLDERRGWRSEVGGN